ncbi:hypothetical protein [Streptomyces chartreusis]|uniref:RNA polymerase sigma factor n=1 Tax=Streptomyces chartreusis TaxID=1969 RepID=UPI002E18DE42
MEGSVRGWLFTVTRHLVIDWVRKPHVRREAVGVTYSEPAAGTDATEAVLDALVATPFLRRLAFRSPGRAGAHLPVRPQHPGDCGYLGVPAGTVKSRHHNALRKLRGVVRPEAEAA